MRFLRVIRLLLALLSNGVFATLVVEVRGSLFSGVHAHQRHVCRPQCACLRLI